MTRLAHLLARNLAVVRRAAGLRQRDLADRVGITLGYIEKIEQGRKVPTLETLEGLAWGLGVDPAYLVQELDVHSKGALAHASGSPQQNRIIQRSSLAVAPNRFLGLPGRTSRRRFSLELVAGSCDDPPANEVLRGRVGDAIQCRRPGHEAPLPIRQA